MLSEPGLEEFLSKVENRCELVMLAAKRANELANGDQPLVKSRSKNPLIIALDEIAAGKIKARRVYPEAE